MMFAILKHNIRLARWLALVALFCIAQLARDVRAVTFEFEYGDPGGQGFFDPVLGDARRAALEYAGDVWGSLIPTAYAGEVITVHVSFADLGAGTPRASTASGYWYPAPTMANTHFPKALANHLSGMDVDPNKDEITIRFNSNLAPNYWYYGLEGNPSPTQGDFVTTSLHEIGHGLGFSDSFRQDGGYGFFGDGTFDPDDEISGLPTIYDQFVTLGPGGTRLLDLPQAQRATAIVSDNVYWNGAQATGANGGSPVQLYAPATYSGGSSIGHVDDSFNSVLMQPTRPDGVAIHVPLANERGVLRDMGWDIAIAPASLTWSGLGADNLWTTAQNWSGGLTPQGGDSVAFGASPQTDVDIQYETGGAGYMFLGAMTFPVDAPSYTLRFKSQTETRITGTGIINFSSNAQTIHLESSIQDDPTQNGDAATLTLINTANAGNADYYLHGGGTSIGGIPPPGGTFFFDRNAGAAITFENNATAGTAYFEIEGGAGNGGPNAQVTFRGNASASAAEFRTKGGKVGPDLPLGNVIAGFSGQVRFEDSAKAGLATFHNEGQAEYYYGAGGFTVFTESSSAENSDIHNHGATYILGYGGGTFFYDSSTAASATITNHADGSNHANVQAQARTIFLDSSTAGMATIENEGAPSQSQRPGHTEFYNNSSAGNATINNRGYITPGDAAGRTLFYDNSTAATATLSTFNGYSDHGRIEFRNQSTAASAHIFLDRDPMVTASLGGYLIFYDNSTAAQSEITLRLGAAGGNGGIQFYNNATAADAQIVAVDNGGQIGFFGTSSAGDPPTADTPAWANFTLGQGNVLSFYDQSTADDAHFTLADRAQIFFQNNSSAGHAQISAAGGSVYTANVGATITFNSNSTADNATILVTGATAPLASPAAVWFINGSHAGNSTLIANGGTGGGAGATVTFTSGATGDTARLVANAGGTFDFAQQFAGGTTTVGSINGAGTFYLRGTELIVGTRNEDSTVTGRIVDTLVSPNYSGGRLTKVGTGTLTLAGTNTYTGLTAINAGTLSVTGSVAGDVIVNNGGTLNGTGTIGGTVAANGGIVSPGLSPGTITIGGLTMMPGSTLDMELGASSSDHIVVTGGGIVSLAGTLNVTLLDGFTPELGDQFTLFTFSSYNGDFTNYTGAAFGGNLELRPVFTSTSFSLSTRPEVDGDINTDGTVDIFDVNSVSANWGTGGPAGDVNGDGIVDIFDVNLISANWGATGTGGGSVTSAAAPEPDAIVLLVIGLAVLLRLPRSKIGLARTAKPRRSRHSTKES